MPSNTDTDTSLSILALHLVSSSACLSRSTSARLMASSSMMRRAFLSVHEKMYFEQFDGLDEGALPLCRRLPLTLYPRLQLPLHYCMELDTPCL